MNLLVDQLLQAANLRRGEIVVEEDDIGLLLFRQVGDFLGLAGSDIRPRVRRGSTLEDLPDDVRAGGFRQ